MGKILVPWEGWSSYKWLNKIPLKGDPPRMRGGLDLAIKIKNLLDESSGSFEVNLKIMRPSKPKLLMKETLAKHLEYIKLKPI